MPVSTRLRLHTSLIPLHCIPSRHHHEPVPRPLQSLIATCTWVPRRVKHESINRDTMALDSMPSMIWAAAAHVTHLAAALESSRAIAQSLQVCRTRRRQMDQTPSALLLRCSGSSKKT